jgi:hypothetical protein
MQSFFRTLTVALVVGVFAVPRGSSAQTNAGWEAGKWKLNVAKSTSNCGPGPQSVMNTWDDRGGDVQVFTQEGTDAQGRPFRNMYTVKYDGKDYPTVVDPTTKAQGSMALKRVGPFTVEFTNKVNGKPTSTTTRTLAQDKKTINMTTKATNAQGQPCTSARVFEKQ